MNIAYPASPEDEHHLPSPSFDPGDAPLSYHGHFVHKHSAACRDWFDQHTLLDLFHATIVFLHQAVHDICQIGWHVLPTLASKKWSLWVVGRVKMENECNIRGYAMYG